MADVIVVGGGASGCMAAITSARRNLKTVLIEKNPKIGRKILITGKGRCNLTNSTDLDGLIKNTVRNGKFLYSAFSAYTADDTCNFFENEGVPLKVERGNRVFPCSDKSTDIIDALYKKLRTSGVEIITETVSNIIIEEDKIRGVVLSNGETLLAQNVIIATGGMSYPLTGSDGDGYKFAKSAGHTVSEISASLIPIETAENYVKSLQGLSLKNVKLTLKESGKNKEIYSDLGEMIFTHFGISGPLVLTASCYIKDLKNKSYDIIIDLKPALNDQELDRRIQNDFSENLNKDFINSLDKLLPQRLIPIFVELSKIDGRKKVNLITKEERREIVQLMKNIKLTVKDLRPIEEAIVTRGGVKVKEIEPKTMMSKLIKGLYFTGEVLDVDAKTGGFNLQIAFSTGYVAGSSVNKGED